MLSSIYKKRFFILLVITFCVITIFTKIQITSATTTTTKPSNEAVANAVYDYLTKNYQIPKTPPATNTVDYYCLYGVRDKVTIDQCTPFCIGAFLTPNADRLKQDIQNGTFDDIQKLAKQDIPKTTLTGKREVDPYDTYDVDYTTTICGQVKGPIDPANDYKEIIAILQNAKKIEDIINAFRGLQIANPNECTPSFISRFSEELNNSPFSIYTKDKEKDICKQEYFDSNNPNIEKAQQCLKNLAIDLRQDEDSDTLNPGHSSYRASQIEALATSLETFANCPNPTHLENIVSAQITALSGVTTYEPTEIPECAIGYSESSLWDLLTQPLNLLIGGLITLFVHIFKFVLMAVIKTFWYALVYLPIKLHGYTGFEPVKIIWKDLLLYANLGIIIGMIFTAIATILRIEKYSWKKLLPKLLLIALLVNFSLVICGMFVDISNFVSIYFLSNSGFSNLAETIGSIIDKIICAFRATPEKFNYTMGATIGLILTCISLFQFIGLLAYVIARIVTIWVCLATSPFAFLGMAIDTEPIKKAVDMWRDNFTQALVSLPILSLALYLSLLFLSQIANYIKAEPEDVSGLIPLIAYAVAIVALAQLLRIIAKNIGVQQIEQGYAFAKKAVTGMAMAGAAAVGGLALGRITASGWYNKLAERLSAKEEMAGAKGGVTGFLSRGLSTQLYKLKGVTAAKQKEKEEKELAKIKDDVNALTNAARNAMILHKPETVVRILVMKAKADLGYTPDERHFMLRLPAQFQHTEDARAVYKYNSALRLDNQGNRIPMDEIINRYKTTPIDQTDVRELIQSLEDRDLQQQFIKGALGPARSIKELADFIQTIPARHQRDFMEFIHQHVLNRSLRDYLADPNINPALVQSIEQPAVNTSTQDMSRISLITRLWNF